MLTIDADAHVIECEKTWDYLEGDDKRYRPVRDRGRHADGQDAKFLDHRRALDRRSR